MSFKISEICHINVENLSKKDKEEYEYINYLDTSSLNEGTISELQKLNISKDKIPSRAKRKVNVSDILISTVRPNQKHYGIIRKMIDNIIVSTGFAVLKPHKNIVYPEYLYRYFTLESVTNYLQTIAENSTSAYPSIKPSVLEKMEIELPPLKEQKVIANTLSTLDEKIETNNQINKNLEEMAQAIFKHWFVDFEFPNEEGQPYKSSGGKMVENELGMIPEGWEVQNIQSTLDFVIGGDWGKAKYSKNYNHKTYCIRGADFPDLKSGNKSDIPVRYIKENSFEKRSLSDGDIILEISGGTKNRPTGRTIYIHEEMSKEYNSRLSFSNFCRVLRTNDVLDSKILYLYLQFLYDVGIMETHQVQSTGISNFQFKRFVENEKIIIPNKNIQEKFSHIIEKLYKKRNTFENYVLSNIRDILLPKLMSGEIRVPLDEEEIEEKVAQA